MFFCPVLVELAAGVGSVLVGGQRMSRRSREAINLARGLWVYWGPGPGGVEVAWTDGWFGERYRQGYEADLDHPAVSEAWRAGLERAEFPERARTAQEQALAGRLVERAMRDYRQTVVAADRARTAGRRPVPWAPPEVLLARAVAAEGLEGAASAANEQDPAGAGEVVVDLDRYRQTRDLGRDGRALE